jgi:copper homeostasis protein
VNVLVRPRVGDFVYSPAEVEVMLRDIEAARTAGADGEAFDCLYQSIYMCATSMRTNALILHF